MEAVTHRTKKNPPRRLYILVFLSGPDETSEYLLLLQALWLLFHVVKCWIIKKNKNYIL